eukprot:3018556-Karenia_brevis.AAC.1
MGGAPFGDEGTGRQSVSEGPSPGRVRRNIGLWEEGAGGPGGYGPFRRAGVLQNGANFNHQQ